MARHFKKPRQSHVGPRHMSCEQCRRRKARCSRTYPCAGCVERGQECVWTSRPLDELPPKSASVIIHENKVEIARLNKIVRQLEAIFAEKEAERAARFPPTPPSDDFSRLPHAPIDYFAQPLPQAPRSTPHSKDFLTPPSNHDHTAFTLPAPPPRHFETYSEPSTWSAHSRASTWPQRPADTPLASTSRAQSHNPHDHGYIHPPSNASSSLPLPFPPFNSIPPAYPDQLEQLSRFLDHAIPDDALYLSNSSMQIDNLVSSYYTTDSDAPRSESIPVVQPWFPV